MKKILALLFVLVLVFSLSSCGSKLIPIMAESDSKDGYFLDINCSDIFSLDAGEIVECQVLYYVKRNWFEPSQPSYLLPECKVLFLKLPVLT